MTQVSFLPPFISAQRIAKVLGALLIVTAAISWFSVGVDYALLSLAGDIRTGAEISRGERLAHTRTASWLGVAQIIEDS